MQSNLNKWIVGIVCLCLLLILPGVAVAQDLVTNTPSTETATPAEPVEAPLVVDVEPEEPVEPPVIVVEESGLSRYEWVLGVLALLVTGVVGMQTLTFRTVINKLLPLLLNFGSGVATLTPSGDDDRAVQTFGEGLGYERVIVDEDTIIWRKRGSPTPTLG